MSNIPEKYIPHIEKALGFELYQFQKNYLLDIGPLRGGRASGKTSAFCIKLALSDGEPLDLKRPWTFSDGWEISNHKRYSVFFFKRTFLDIRDKLKDYGFRVRDVK